MSKTCSQTSTTLAIFSHNLKQGSNNSLHLSGPRGDPGSDPAPSVEDQALMSAGGRRESSPPDVGISLRDRVRGGRGRGDEGSGEEDMGIE